MRRLIVTLLPLAVPTALMCYMHIQIAYYERREKRATEAAQKRRQLLRHM